MAMDMGILQGKNFDCIDKKWKGEASNHDPRNYKSWHNTTINAEKSTSQDNNKLWKRAAK